MERPPLSACRKNLRARHEAQPVQSVVAVEIEFEKERSMPGNFARQHNRSVPAAHHPGADYFGVVLKQFTHPSIADRAIDADIDIGTRYLRETLIAVQDNVREIGRA